MSNIFYVPLLQFFSKNGSFEKVDEMRKEIDNLFEKMSEKNVDQNEKKSFEHLSSERVAEKNKEKKNSDKEHSGSCKFIVLVLDLNLSMKLNHKKTELVLKLLFPTLRLL